MIDSTPDALPKEDIPMVTYTLTTSNYSKLFNHKKTVGEINVTDFVNNENIYPCNCENSPFKDRYHGHIITGDLRIIENNKLRKIICKGPKYRLPTPNNLDKAKENILNGIK